MSQTPFKGTPQVKEDQVSLEGDCRDYRDTSREMRGDDKDTTAHSVALLASESACHNANLKTTSALKKQAG